MTISFLSALMRAESARQRARCLHSPGGVHAFLRVQHKGRRMLFIRFVNRAVQAVWRSHHKGRKQARDSGHSPFRGPARGRSPRARISLLAPFQQTGGSTDSRSSVNIGAIDHCAGFSFSLCVTLAPKPTLKSLPSTCDAECRRVSARLQQSRAACSIAWQPEDPRPAVRTTS